MHRTCNMAYLPRRGRDKPAQGNALGDVNHHRTLALKGRHKRTRTRNFTDCFALSGLANYARIRSQGVALGWFVAAPSGQIRRTGSKIRVVLGCSLNGSATGQSGKLTYSSNRFRNTPMPSISASATSPGFR
jgi:hypothetical protein